MVNEENACHFHIFEPLFSNHSKTMMLKMKVDMKASKGYPFKNIFDITTAGDWDCVAAVERLPALHYSVILFSSPLGSWVSLWNFETIRGSLMTPKWQKLVSLAQEICTLWFQFFGAVFASKGYPFKNIFMYFQLLKKYFLTCYH